MHKRKALFDEEFHNVDELIAKLEEVALFARVNGHSSPAVECSTDCCASGFTVYEETLSDASTQLVLIIG
jgi:hypothetical protein